MNNDKIITMEKYGDTYKIERRFNYLEMYINNYYQGLYKNTQTFLRFLYVSISRAKSASQLHFLYEQVQEVANEFVSNEPLFDYLSNVNKIDTDSPTLCSSDILDTILSTLSTFLPNLPICPVYNIDTPEHLVMGHILNTLETPAKPYQFTEYKHIGYAGI